VTVASTQPGILLPASLRRTQRGGRPATVCVMRDHFDVIVVGSRVAGAATAMLLARQGARVLAVDRARFPSDTLSTHQLQLPGVALLRRWGLLDRLVASGAPGVRRVRADIDGVVVDGVMPTYGGVDALYSPRRTVLDALLVSAARDAGAEVHDNVIVDGLVWRGDRVAGIRAFRRGERPTALHADLVVGADGKHSFVADAVGAARYRVRPSTTVASYTYWAGVTLDHGELYHRRGRAVAAFPTNDGLVIVYIAAPAHELPAIRADIEGHHLRTLDTCGDLGARVRAGRRAERFRTTPDLPNHFREPIGDGWALVGDAGVVMDPVTAQGISNAFRDAQRLADALARGDTTRLRHGRDMALTPMYDLTQRVAALRPVPSRARPALRALRGHPGAVTLLLSMFSGVTTPDAAGLWSVLAPTRLRPIVVPAGR
jgi:2-polyprenyl-6-methoxyphenol hydroxylase-like FAD-dependent oxidoreductase